jgi:hypothetical protein
MSSKQKELGNVDEASIRFSDESISQLLEIIFKVKSLNNNWYNRLANLGKQWQTMLSSRKSALKKEIEADKYFESNKKDSGPTMASFNSFANN